ncbi:hypothetical protein Rhsp01_49190 [Rhizobium sp. NBRC 114257]|uniref:Uncharacterized protein n=1 Tax=Rhizobium dioscoreae TaxID=2653122 RepID=A0ABQ0ZAM2_9HYPH|nr:hypothetical protein RsS93_50320 [Rhizobium dioscoreae]GLU83743.1 hypothetical protein Rhsp01_49190 [Rhizobium sp. NBRC 114257]
MHLARADHLMSQCTPADGNTGALEDLAHAIERCAVDIFMNEAKAGVEAVAMLLGKGCAGIVAMMTGVLTPARSQFRHAYLNRTFCRTLAFTST